MRFFKKKNLGIHKQEMMAEMILFNEIKTPVGASSELLMNEPLSRSFKRFVQTTDSSDVYAWANESLTQPIRSKHWIIQQLLIAVRCAVVQPKMWPNIIVFAYLTVYRTIEQS